jgi:hypothetical protein
METADASLADAKKNAPARRVGRTASASTIPEGTVQRPQSAIREAAAMRGDAHDAVDGLRRHWQRQLDQQVAELPFSYPLDTSHEKDSAKADSRKETPRSRENADALADRQDETPAAMQKNAAGRTAQHTISSAPEKTPASRDEDASCPEERVDRGLRLLRDAPDARPVRNLGSLQDFPDIALPAPDEKRSLFHAQKAMEGDAGLDADPPEHPVPWENPAAHGWLKAFTHTLHGALFQTPYFFSRLSASASLGLSYLFFLIMGYVAILSAHLWTQALAVLLPGTIQDPASHIALPVLLLLAPIALGLTLLFITACIRIFLLLFTPEKSDFFLVYKIVSYATAPFILSLVPFIGPAIGAAWFVMILIVGCRNALNLSWKLAVLAPLPPTATLLSGLAWYFL